MPLNEIRYVGPPGTGKTTELARQVEVAASDYGAEAVMVCSLTRAAAAEVAGRVMGVHVGTLHSFAYHALDAGEITDTPKGVKRWNTWIGEQGLAHLKLSAASPDLDDTATESYAGETAGDVYLNLLQVARARLQDLDQFPSQVQEMRQLWQEFKDADNSCDFTDLLEDAHTYTLQAPGNPSVIFMDEAQDTSMLGMRLARKWGSACERLVIFGDPLQNLYHWAGTDADAFTTPDVPADCKHVLHQSYRVPRAVHGKALQWIAPLKRELEREMGREIEYAPRDADGEVRGCDAHFKYPEPAVDEAQAAVKEGRTVMFLAACSYMLEPTLAVLRQRGIPFHNPWRRKRSDWNPLAPRKTVTPKDRILSFLRLCPAAWQGPRRWNVVELWQWLEGLEAAGVLKRGAKKEIETRAKEKDDFDELPVDVLAGWFESESLVGALLASDGGDISWLIQRSLAGRKKSLAYPAKVFEVHGAPGLRDTPQITVGTIHSLKGSQADICFLYPDLSQSGMQEWCRSGPGRDGILRAFYVAQTRARESLILCGQATPLAVEL